MKNCPGCGSKIEDRYDLCSNCYRKKQDEKDSEIPNLLSNINNNLYAIRTILDEMAYQTSKKRLMWVPTSNEIKAHYEMVKSDD